MVKLKVGYVTSSLSSAGGWARYSKGIIESVSKMTDVIVLTRRDAENEADGFTIYPVLPTQDNSFHPRIQCNVFLNTLRYLRGCSVIHSMIEPFACGAALASHLLGARFFLTLHGTYAVPPKVNSPKAFCKRQMMRVMYRLATIKTTGSPKNVSLVEEVLPLGDCRIIPNGVDPETFCRINLDGPTQPFLLTVGAVKPRKGVDITIRALALLKEEFPNLLYKIVGETVSGSSFFAYAKGLTREHDLESRVEFLGRITDEELCRLYNRCSVFILAAQTRNGAFEGFPMVFYEAQACGAPIISTRGFGSEYVVKDGYNGFLTNEDDVVGTAEAVKKIIRNTDLRAQMVKNSLYEASKHTWDHAAAQVMNMYQDGLKVSSQANMRV